VLRLNSNHSAGFGFGQIWECFSRCNRQIRRELTGYLRTTPESPISTNYILSKLFYGPIRYTQEGLATLYMTRSFSIRSRRISVPAAIMTLCSLCGRIEKE
jgi:hypothetical protein